MVFGVWGIVSGSVGMVVFVVVVLIFGIVVDDIVYFLSCYLDVW